MSHLRTISMLSLLAVGAGGACERKADRQPAADRGPSGEMGRQGSEAPLPGTTSQPSAEDLAARESLADVDKDLRKVLKEQRALGAKPLETLTPEEARRQPTLADAARSLLQREGKQAAPEEVAKVEDRTIQTPSGALPLRIYTPREGKSPYPVAMYYHGGGFVIGSVDSYDATARALANGAEAIVVSVEYRKAPEHKFPAAHEDAYAAYKWVVSNAAAFGGDPKNVATTGESAGGNLAANVAIMARDKGDAQPVHLLLVYPLASADMTTPSYVEHENAQPLDKKMMKWFTEQYFRTPADAKDPRIDLLHANLTGLAPTTIISAEIDPLYSDSRALEQKLKEAGVVVEQKTYDDVTHEFFGMVAVVDEARDAVRFASSRLDESFSKRKGREVSIAPQLE
jgi:acetyl esterase